jgi:hypothetical protein
MSVVLHHLFWAVFGRDWGCYPNHASYPGGGGRTGAVLKHDWGMIRALLGQYCLLWGSTATWRQDWGSCHISVGCTNQILVRSDSWLGHQGAKTENTKRAITPELIARSSPNFGLAEVLISLSWTCFMILTTGAGSSLTHSKFEVSRLRGYGDFR